MEKKNVLSVKNLNKIYSKNGSSTVNALNNLNLEVKEGEIFGLLKIPLPLNVEIFSSFSKSSHLYNTQ